MSIRAQLCLIAIIVALPAACIIIYSGVNLRNEAINEAGIQIQKLADRIESEQQNLVVAEQQLLIALAQLPDVKNHNAARVQSILSEILKLNSQYSNIIIADPAGNVWASALPTRPFNVSDRRYFKNAILIGQLASGGYIISRVTHKPVLNFGYPLKNAHGQITGVICVGVNLAYYRRLLEKSKLPAGADFVLIDYQGIIFSGAVDPTQYVGEQENPELFKHMSDGVEGDTFIEQGADGIKWSVTYRKLRLKGEHSPYMYIRAGIPVKIVLSRANSALLYNLIFFASFLLLASFLAWLIGKRSIADRVSLLENASQRLAGGDHGVRVSDLVVGGELGRLGKTFDNMAQQLAVRQRDLIEYQSFFANLMQNSATATFVLDKSHRVMIWNKACEELTGCPESEMIGTDYQWKPFYSYQRPTVADVVIDDISESLPGLYKIYSRSALNPHGLRAEGWYKNLGGKDRYIVFEASPIHNNEGELIAAIETLQDITESKKLEDQLFQSQKMEAIGHLAGGIAHDFNNMLTAIIGFGGLMQMDINKDSRSKAYLDQVMSAAEKAANLAQGLLAFSRKQVINPKPISLNDVITNMKEILARIIGEDIELKMVLTDDDLTVMADSGQIEQVLMNLATNARDSMPGGGHLTVETGAADIDKDYARTHGYGESGRYAFISVEDTGYGMDEKTRESIFEPFFTTKEFGRGTGLGLSIVYGIIKQHNGYINVYSEINRGSTFRIYLPMIEIEIKKAKEKASLPPIGGTETILLVEDEEKVRLFTKTTLERFGYKVIDAVDGDDGTNKFIENKDSIQLLVLDVIMPKKNGKEVYEEIRKIRPGIKALFTSGYTGDLLSEKGILDEGLNFISKPLSPNALLSKVREVLDKKDQT